MSHHSSQREWTSRVRILFRISSPLCPQPLSPSPSIPSLLSSQTPFCMVYRNHLYLHKTAPAVDIALLPKYGSVVRLLLQRNQFTAISF